MLRVVRTPQLSAVPCSGANSVQAAIEQGCDSSLRGCSGDTSLPVTVEASGLSLGVLPSCEDGSLHQPVRY